MNFVIVQNHNSFNQKFFVFTSYFIINLHFQEISKHDPWPNICKIFVLNHSSTIDVQTGPKFFYFMRLQIDPYISKHLQSFIERQNPHVFIINWSKNHK